MYMRFGKCVSCLRRLPIQRPEVWFVVRGHSLPADEFTLRFCNRDDRLLERIHSKPPTVLAQPTDLCTRPGITGKPLQFLWREKHVGCAARANNSAGLITICRPETLRQGVDHGHTTFQAKAATN